MDPLPEPSFERSAERRLGQLPSSSDDEPWRRSAFQFMVRESVPDFGVASFTAAPLLSDFSIYSRLRSGNDDRIMATMLQLIAGHKVQNFATGDVVMEQGTASGPLLVLIEGEVEILRDGIRVAKCSTAGAVFGEMSVLLGSAHTATVRTLKPGKFAIIENPREFLAASADASLHVANLLAVRLDALTKYLVDVKQQYEGHDHIGMVDEVLETLMHRQPRPPAL
jgi:CRP/FNR family cyclic AMP-dependent transcriptional regulator